MLDDKYKGWIIEAEKISDSTIDKHIQILKNNGNTLSTTQDWINFVQREQKKSLEKWFNFFNQYNVNETTREWILESIKKMADFNHATYQFHRRNIHTIHPFAEINSNILLEIIEEQKKTSFKKTYEQKLEVLLKIKSNIGVWKTYQNSQDYQQLSNSLQGYFTRWCITNEDVSYLHLLEGQIDVFYSKLGDNFLYPRLAIGRNKREINRCIGIDQNQEIEKELIPETLKRIEEIDLPINRKIELKLIKHR